MNTTKQISLNIDTQTQCIYVSAMQGDNKSRYINIQFIDGIEIFTIPENCIARIAATKPDKTQILNDCTIQDNMVQLQLTEQFLAVEGTVSCTVSLYNSETDERISAVGFHLIVNKSQFSDLKLSSFSESTALIKLLDKLEKFEKAINECQFATNQTLNLNKLISGNFDSIKAEWEQMKSQIEMHTPTGGI